MKIPSRTNLVSQVVDSLHDALANREWISSLPGEHFLCDRLQVSRSTLRAALRVLEREGLIIAHQGKPRKIIKHHRRLKSALPNRIQVLSGIPFSQLPQSSLRLYAEIREHLHRAGLECEYLSASRSLKTLVEKFPCRAWMLMGCADRTQRWFYENAIPSLLMGHRYAGINLPFVDIDYFGVSQHAARSLLVRGHRRIAILLPESIAPGDLLSVRGFEDAIKTSKIPEVAVLHVSTNSTRSAMQRMAERLFCIKPKLTALYVASADTAAALVSLLLHNGIKIPEDLSLVSRDSNSTLDYFSPDITRYRLEPGRESHKLSLLAAHLANSGAIRDSSHFLLPRFHSGATLKKIEPAG